MRQHHHDHSKRHSGFSVTPGSARPVTDGVWGRAVAGTAWGLLPPRPPGLTLSGNRAAPLRYAKQRERAGQQLPSAATLRGRGCPAGPVCTPMPPGMPPRTQEGSARSAGRGLLGRRWLRRCRRGLPVRDCTALWGGALQCGAAAAAGQAVRAQGEAAAGARCAVLHRVHRLQSLQCHTQPCRTRRLVPSHLRGLARQRRHAAQAPCSGVLGRTEFCHRCYAHSLHTPGIRGHQATMAGTWGSTAPAAVSAQMRLASGAARCTLAPADVMKPRNPLRCSLAARPWPMHALRPTNRLNEGIRAPGACSLGGAWHGQEWTAKAELAGQP